MSDFPLQFVWHGDSFVPASLYWQRKADARYTIGQRYLLTEAHERSHNSHAHYFASVTEAWRSLPEHLAEEFPTAEHLRKYALIKTGYCNRQTVVFATRKDAEKAAAILSPLDEFSIVDVQDRTLTRYTAKSQSYRGMEKVEFQASKDAVLELLASMIGVAKSELPESEAA